MIITERPRESTPRGRISEIFSAAANLTISARYSSQNGWMYAPLPVADRRARDRSPAPAVFGLGEDAREQVAELLDRKPMQLTS